MPKIELPPKVKCWKCGGIPLAEITPYDECDCDDGYRYDFDDLAAAVNNAKCGYESYNGYQVYAAIIRKAFTKPRFEIEYKKWTEYGNTPTAALLAAILKHNEACDD